VEDLSPGPAAYSALNPSKIKETSPAYSLGGRWNDDSKSPFHPGGIFECIIIFNRYFSCGS
jgi:hypothetical protein